MKARDKEELKVDIEQGTWANAYAGDYKDIVTFAISYVNSN